MSSAREEGPRRLQPLHTPQHCPDCRHLCCHRTAGCPAASEGCGSQGSSGHTSEEEQRCFSHARAALASTRLVTGKSQPRSALPSVKWILAAPPLKQSRRSGAMAGALSHGSPASSAPCESAPSRAGAGCPRTAHVQPAGQSQASTSLLRSPRCAGCPLGRRTGEDGAKFRLSGQGGMTVTSPPASLGSACRVRVKDEEWVRPISDEAVVPTVVPHCCPLSLHPRESGRPDRGAAPQCQAPSPLAAMCSCPGTSCQHPLHPEEHSAAQPAL